MKSYCDQNGSGEVQTTVIGIDFKEEITQNAELVDCTRILSANDNDLNEEERRIKQYCKVNVTEVSFYRDGIKEIYTMGKDTYKRCITETNCETVKLDGSAFDVASYCQKSTCFVATKIYADCT